LSKNNRKTTAKSPNGDDEDELTTAGGSPVVGKKSLVADVAESVEAVAELTEVNDEAVDEEPIDAVDEAVALDAETVEAVALDAEAVDAVAVDEVAAVVEEEVGEGPQLEELVVYSYAPISYEPP